VEDQRRFHQDSRRASQDQARAGRCWSSWSRKKRSCAVQRDEILREAREEARHLLKRAKSDVDGLIKELQQIRSAAGGDSLVQAEQVRRLFHEIRREVGPEETEPSEPRPLTQEELTAGQAVMVRSLNQPGEIIAVAGGEATVQVGSMKVHVPVDDLRRPLRRPDRPKEPVSGSGYTVRKNLAMSREVHLRGMTVDEALHTVDKFMDDALWAGLPSVTVIHGKGTGKLKAALRAYLKEHRQVRGYRSGVPSEGGDGVTVVDLST
jgi:DNA mismatch repair protein MutS2